MMKVAQIEGGKNLAFPESADDAAVDRAIKAFLDVRDEPNEHEKAMMAMVQSVLSLQEEIKILTQMTNETSKQIGQMTTAIQANARNLEMLAKTTRNYASSMEQVAQAISAPRMLIKDDKNEVIGVRPDLEKAQDNG